MLIPLWILIWLPKSIQEKQIQLHWDKKTDEQIISSYKDCKEWVDSLSWLNKKQALNEEYILVELEKDCHHKMNRYILPQIKKRNLKVE